MGNFSNSFYIRQTALQPHLFVQVLQADDVTPVDLTTMTSAVFRMRTMQPATSLVVNNQPMIVINPKLGELRYEWQTGDTGVPGRYFGEVQCNFPTNSPLVVPWERQRIVITPYL
jgi:hypothetical protein